MQLQFETDQGLAAKAAFGLIVLQADETLENEIRPLFDQEGVTLNHTRIKSAPEVTRDTLLQMKAQLTDAAAMLPSARPLDVIGYGCTSASSVIGSEAVAAAIAKAHPGAKVTDPAAATVAALRHLNVSRIGILTPYIPDVSKAVVNVIASKGFDPVATATFSQSEEAVVARITPASVKAAICEVGSGRNVEAVFASCTNLRTFDVIASCENILGKPVISSNSALAWHMMTLAGVSPQGRGPGQLFTARGLA